MRRRDACGEHIGSGTQRYSPARAPDAAVIVPLIGAFVAVARRHGSERHEFMVPVPGGRLNDPLDGLGVPARQTERVTGEGEGEVARARSMCVARPGT
jgi:hypothetical protein